MLDLKNVELILILNHSLNYPFNYDFAEIIYIIILTAVFQF